MEGLRIGVLTFLSVSVLISKVWGFNVPTHQAMSETAVSGDSDFDTFLRTDLAFARGAGQRLGANDVKDWIKYGSGQEDGWSVLPLPGRFLNHFHDPLVNAWTAAGLVEPITGNHESSIVWMQDGTNDWNWRRARDQYYWALTSGQAEMRDWHWGNTFRGLGQIMHLVEDAGVPEHVRNDSHEGPFLCGLLFGLMSCGGNFEYWVSDAGNAGAFDYAGGPPLDQSLLYQPTLHPEAPLPLARLIDMDAYDGSNPNVTVGPAIGLGEFTNANFFSEDTIPGPRQYPHPNVNALVPTYQPTWDSRAIRQYYQKAAGDGLQVGPVAVESVFSDASSTPIFSVDAMVWRATARVVVPRAVSYARGAVDYFFRGRLQFARDPANAAQYVIKNGGPEDLSGTFELYAEDELGNRTRISDGVWTPTQPVPAHGEVVVPAFTPSPTARQYILVFHGTMGNEAPVGSDSIGAVAAKVIPVGRWVLMGFHATYQSGQLDQGWQKVADGPLKMEYTSGRNYSPLESTYVNEDLLFASIGMFDYGAGLPVWRSTDGGRHFEDISAMFATGSSDGIFLTNVTSLGGRELMASYYRKTPNSYGYLDTSQPGGVLYSPDLGAAWQQVGPPIYPLMLMGPRITYVGHNAVGDPVVLLIGAVDAALLMSTDRGQHWSAIAGADDLRGGEPMVWNQVEGPGSVILAIGGGEAGIVRSLDQGQTWQRLGMPVDGTYRSLAISPRNEVLLTAEHYFKLWKVPPFFPSNAWSHVLYRSTDAGETWELANDPTGPPDPWDLYWDPPGRQVAGVAYLGTPESIP